MRYATVFISALILILSLNSSLNARIINIPDDQETIQNGIDATEFPSGIYFCQLDVNNEQRMLKLALIR